MEKMVRFLVGLGLGVAVGFAIVAMITGDSGSAALSQVRAGDRARPGIARTGPGA